MPSRKRGPQWGDELIAGLREVRTALEGGERMEDICRVEPVVRPPAAFPARRVRGLRHRIGVSQAAFAQMLAVSPKTVQSWERDGVSMPAMRRLLELTEAKYAPQASQQRRRAG